MKKSIIISILVIIGFGFLLSNNYLKDDAIINLEIEFLSTDSINNIEVFYNKIRSHSTIGYFAPVEFEESEILLQKIVL